MIYPLPTTRDPYSCPRLAPSVAAALALAGCSGTDSASAGETAARSSSRRPTPRAR